MNWKKFLPWIGMAAAALLCFALGFLIPVAAEEEPVDPMQFLSEVVNAETLTLMLSGGDTIPEESIIHDEALREKKTGRWQYVFVQQIVDGFIETI